MQTGGKKRILLLKDRVIDQRYIVQQRTSTSESINPEEPFLSNKGFDLLDLNLTSIFPINSHFLLHYWTNNFIKLIYVLSVFFVGLSYFPLLNHPKINKEILL